MLDFTWYWAENKNETYAKAFFNVDKQQRLHFTILHNVPYYIILKFEVNISKWKTL